MINLEENIRKIYSNLFPNSPYPYSLLLPLYKNKRDKMRRLLSHFPIGGGGGGVDAPCALIVDGLCRQGATLV